MFARPVTRYVFYLGWVGIVALLVMGCATRQTPALADLNQAHAAIAEAKMAGADPAKVAQLEQRHAHARGIFFACKDAEASREAQSIIADARRLLVKPVAAAPPPPPANRAPRARLSVPGETEVNVAVALSAAESSDPDGDRLTYRWDFGDGSSADLAVANAAHPYAKPGTYTVRVTVDDGRGGSDTATAPLVVIRRMVLQESKERVLFDFDRATLRPEARQELTSVVQEMRENPTLRAELVGHADATGAEAYNMGLSQRRAEAVRNFLGSQGIAANRLTLAWKGESMPIATNATAEGRAQNRRVEITVRPIPVQ